METVDRLKSEKEDLEQEMRDLSTRNELLRANNEVQGSSLAASDVDIDDGGDGGNYYAMYEEMKSSYDRLLGQKEKLGREYHAALEELVRKKSSKGSLLFARWQHRPWLYLVAALFC